MSGKLVNCSKVDDSVFSSELLGPTIGLIPDRTTTTALAPVSGRVATLTNHAVVIQPPNQSWSLLLHLGIDTVRLSPLLQEKHLHPLISSTAIVTRGQPIFAFEVAQLNNMDIDTSVIMCWITYLGQVKIQEDRHVSTGQTLWQHTNSNY